MARERPQREKQKKKKQQSKHQPPTPLVSIISFLLSSFPLLLSYNRPKPQTSITGAARHTAARRGPRACATRGGPRPRPPPRAWACATRRAPQLLMMSRCPRSGCSPASRRSPASRWYAFTCKEHAPARSHLPTHSPHTHANNSLARSW